MTETILFKEQHDLQGGRFPFGFSDSEESARFHRDLRQATSKFMFIIQSKRLDCEVPIGELTTLESWPSVQVDQLSEKERVGKEEEQPGQAQGNMYTEKQEEGEGGKGACEGLRRIRIARTRKGGKGHRRKVKPSQVVRRAPEWVQRPAGQRWPWETGAFRLQSVSGGQSVGKQGQHRNCTMKLTGFTAQ